MPNPLILQPSPKQIIFFFSGQGSPRLYGHRDAPFHHLAAVGGATEDVGVRIDLETALRDVLKSALIQYGLSRGLHESWIGHQIEEASNLSSHSRRYLRFSILQQRLLWNAELRKLWPT